MQGMTSEQVAQVLRNCGNSVRMLVARDPVGQITVTPPTPVSLPVALPAITNGTLGSVSIKTILISNAACDSMQDEKFFHLGDHNSISHNSMLIFEAGRTQDEY